MNNQTVDDLYRSYMLDVYRYLLSLCHDHHLAEDLTQETFFRAYLYIEDVDETRLKQWLFRVAHNVLIDHTRKHKRTIVKDKTFFQQFGLTDDLEETIVRQEQVEHVRRFMSKLPEKQKQALLLSDFHDLAYKEAALIMKVSLSHFKILLFRARQALRKQKERDDARE